MSDDTRSSELGKARGRRSEHNDSAATHTPSFFTQQFFATNLVKPSNSSRLSLLLSFSAFVRQVPSTSMVHRESPIEIDSHYEKKQVQRGTVIDTHTTK